jgi:hypothetical protein
MPDWSSVRSEIESWVTDVTGLPTYWRRRPRGWVSEDEGYILLSLSSRRSRGIDEVHLEYDATAAAGEEFTPWQFGQRTFVLEVQVRTWRSDDDVDALHYTSLLRDSLRLPRASRAFQRADVAFARIVNETGIESEQDGRQMSVAQLDLLFNGKSEQAGEPFGYVETVESTLQAPQGVDRWSGDFEI